MLIFLKKKMQITLLILEKKMKMKKRKFINEKLKKLPVHQLLKK